MSQPRRLRVLIVGLGGVTHTFRHWPERVLALALVRRGHQVAAIGTHDPQRSALAQTHETIDGVHVVRVPPCYAPNRTLARALATLPRPDLIHLMHPRNVLAAQVTHWAQQHAIPTVYTWLGPFHDAYLAPDRERPFEQPPTYDRLIFSRADLLRRALHEPNPRELLRNYRLHMPLAAAHALLPCSHFEASVMRQFGLRQPQTVVPLWIDQPFISDTPRTPPTYPFPRPWLLFVGQITPRKGYDIALYALAELVQTHPTATLLIVSGINQAQRARLDMLAQQLGVAAHVQVLGYLPDAALINLYRASDALLFPTRYEGFGLPLLEAMAAECPIITSDIPVVREIVQHGQNGLLFPYNDSRACAHATRLLLDQPRLRQHMVAGGTRTLATSYAEATCMAQIEACYFRVS